MNMSHTYFHTLLNVFCFIIFIIVSGVQSENTAYNCPPGQVWTCNNDCQKRCGSTNCPMNCKHGCYCPPGEKLHNGACIPEKECPIPTACSGDLVWTDCGSLCEQTCNADNCPYECKPGCFCPKGLKKLQDNSCVHKYQCPSKGHRCPQGQIWSCSNNCMQTCGTAICEPFCTMDCFCPPEFKRYNGTCIPKKKCPIACPGGLEWSACGNICEQECNSVGCPKVCEVGCFCPKGQKMFHGHCIAARKCPPKVGDCPPGLIWSSCGNACAQSCTSYFCNLVCEIGCFCPGNLKWWKGQCIHPSYCPDKRHRECTGGRYYSTCGNPCLDQCNSYYCPHLCKETCVCPFGTKFIDGWCRPESWCYYRRSLLFREFEN